MNLRMALSLLSLMLASCAAPITGPDDARCKEWPPKLECRAAVEKAYSGEVRDPAQLGLILGAVNPEAGLQAFIGTVLQVHPTTGKLLEGGADYSFEFGRSMKVDVLPGRYRVVGACRRGSWFANYNVEVVAEPGAAYEIQCRFAPGESLFQRGAPNVLISVAPPRKR